jgi:hypothetical protein
LLGRIANLKSSKEYLKECSYSISMSDLYDVKETCHYHQGMDYCPVLIDIKATILQDKRGAKYLLQVWKRHGEKVFERPLKNEIKHWSISYKYFLYKPEKDPKGLGKDDEDSDYWHLVYFGAKGVELFYFKDFAGDLQYKYCAYADRKIYISDEEQIKIAEVNISDDKIGVKQEDIPSYSFTFKI